ncbi:hypothetical protein S58_66200 [Bradyrhizobium oligotrophicum S58]|uniref:Knr4/Smi1-like domain-containing protein n=2 Tax=Bradyrhizobium oligotrophicum TaxID=44255 RepID=M4ZFG6_9BRAD|nr:hypothetical protein S58_66200 [Bradyrhizobium oligotrophicum S58]
MAMSGRDTVRWTKGYTRSELDRAQRRFGLVFPPDLIALLTRRRPVDGHDWTDERAIRRALEWPFESLHHAVETGQLWWSEWGRLPSTARARADALPDIVSRAPKLIPLIAHRYLPEQPHESGNPVFSIYGVDAIYYGANLNDYFEREFTGWSSKPWPAQVKHIPFWSDLVERFAQDTNAS